MVVIAAVPLYGHFVHAARHDQALGLVIILCWLVTCVAAAGFTVGAVWMPAESASRRRTQRVFAVGLLVLAAVGWSGARAAYYELIAG